MWDSNVELQQTAVENQRNVLNNKGTIEYNSFNHALIMDYK